MIIISQAPAAAVLTLTSGAATQTFNVVAGLPGAGTQCNLNAPGANRLNGVPFVVRAAGIFTLPASTVTSSATPIQLEISGSNTASFAVASGNALYSSTAIAIFTYTSATAVNMPWEIELQLVGGGLNLAGRGINSTATPNNAQVGTTFAAIAQSPASINWATEPPVQFAVSFITAAANLLPAGSTCQLTSFVLEA